VHRYVNSEMRRNSKLKHNIKKCIRYSCVKIKRLPTLLPAEPTSEEQIIEK